MTDAELIRLIARLGYSIWDDIDDVTCKQLHRIADRLEQLDPPPPRQSDK